MRTAIGISALVVLVVGVLGGLWVAGWKMAGPRVATEAVAFSVAGTAVVVGFAFLIAWGFGA